MEEHKQYHKRLYLAYRDLFDCKKYAEVLLKKSKGNLGTDERVIFEALLTSFVISYGRAFVKSYIGNNNASKKYNAFIKTEYEKLTEKEQKEHRFLLNNRDKIFAHSDLKLHDLTLHTIQGSVGYFGNAVFYGYEKEKIDNIVKIVDYFITKILEQKKKIENEYRR